MILEKINSPQDLKELNLDELKTLSAEVRDLIIKVVSGKGGHLASSLGAVELCVGLHHCLCAPADTIIFDVGHQAYAHKILTGRRNSFSTIRESKGISGFPHAKESVYDTYISGHASTAVSWAQGIAEAKRLQKNETDTVAVIGDGSLTGGMCFEALNSCGHSQSEVLVVLNHNEMSISQSVGAVSRYLTKIISAPAYNRLRDEIQSFIKHLPLGKRIVPHAKKLEETLKGLVTPGLFFEELGFRYFGPIDGHDLEVLIPTLKNVMALKGPRLLHVMTKKGKGYKYSEENPEDFHSASSFHIEDGTSLTVRKDTFGEVLAKKLTSLAEKDERIVAITAAMPKGTGLSIFGEKFPKRLYDVGIAEEHAVGFASGLARGGLKPVVAIYSTFMQRAFDQIVHDVALQNLGVIFALDRAGAVGEDGPTHHGVFDVGYMRLVPNLVCMAPKDIQELEDMIEFAINLNSPVSIRYPKGNAYNLDSHQKVELGKSQVMSEGKDVCLVALGSMVKTGLECTELLAKEGINASLVNARFIKPLDENLLRSLSSQFKLIITLEEGNLNCGFGSAVLEFYEKEDLIKDIKLIRAGFPDEFIPHASREELFKVYGLDADSITARIKKLISQKVNV